MRAVGGSLDPHSPFLVRPSKQPMALGRDLLTSRWLEISEGLTVEKGA